MISLLDVNLLIALAWPTHVHHRAALAWFRENQALGWATCPLTQSGFVRVSANEKALPDAKTPQEAVLLLRRIVALPHHQFWQDDVSLATSQLFDVTRLTGYRQVTDAHLVTLALHRVAGLPPWSKRSETSLPEGMRQQTWSAPFSKSEPRDLARPRRAATGCLRVGTSVVTNSADRLALETLDAYLAMFRAGVAGASRRARG